MKTYLQAYFDELKSRVLAKSGIEHIVPADCYRLALDIKAITHRSVSQTTLKRVFGFAASIHRPSIYTLNALAEYCGFDGWDNFYAYMEQQKMQISHQKYWTEVSMKATKISLFNIQSNKHKCGIPYNKTIDREYFSEFVHHFYSSNATASIFSGPAGYGKTVAVTRWVDKQISQNHLNSCNDIYLFINSLSILQASAYGYHASSWLAHLLDIGSAELLDRFLRKHKDSAPGNFLVIIDELQSDLLTEKQFHTIINQFNEMVQYFAEYSWFRLILVLRTTTLYKFETIFKDTADNPLWFSTFNRGLAARYTEIPPFSNAELYELASKLRPKVPIQPLLTVKNILKKPLFLQYFYELYGDAMNLAAVSLFDEYMVVAQYIKKKIFNGVNTFAKQALMEQLSVFVKTGSALFANRVEVYDIIRRYRSAYNDLLYTGVVYEKGTGYNLRQEIHIEFQSTTLVSYFKALKLFNSQLKPLALINILNHRSGPRLDTTICELLWIILFYMETGNISLLHHIDKIESIKKDPLQIIAFVCDGLHKLGTSNFQLTTKSTTSHTIISNISNSPFIDYVAGTPLYNKEFRTSIVKLLDFDLSKEQEIVLRSKLAIDALLRWNETVLLDQLEKLSMLPATAYAGMLINPYQALSCLYGYFKAGMAEQALIYELDKLAARFASIGNLESNQTFDVLVYLLVKVTGNKQVARYYSETIRVRLDIMDPKRIFEVELTSVLCALFLLECDEEEKAEHYIKLCSNLQEHSILSLVYTLYRIHLLKRRNENYKNLIPIVVAISENYGFRLLEMYCSLLTIDNIPKQEQLRQISLLKLRLTAPQRVQTKLQNNTISL